MMKIIVILCLLLLALGALIQYLCYHRHKKEFDVFYQDYVTKGYFIPPYVAFADSLGMLGTSLKAQWFLWILKNKKIKIRDQVWLDAKTYAFVQKTTSPALQKWLALDFIFLLVEAFIIVVGCIFIFLIKNRI
ncbi:hypothetical protein [Serratia quinivorans]|jgi:hypothetical protein|uniref:hypothetical protein n=1 Tax=Serratia quinivorans TaxID=137545 RepID=UPI0028F6D69B|nr:hypothetical protein [Serratia quinivorans]